MKKEQVEEKYIEIAKSIASLVSEKQQAYGNSFGRSQEIIKVLYPNGVHTDDYRDFLTIVRVIDKLFRIANRKDAFGENPWRDIMGYALLATANEVNYDDLKLGQ